MYNEEMRRRTCCFTGHRHIANEELHLVKQRLRNTIIYAVDHGYLYFGTGGALGFDTLAAESVLELKTVYHDIRLILVLPCLSQTKNWQQTDIKKYSEIKSQADKVVFVSKEYSEDCMFKRNRHLVDNSSLCICYLNKLLGGTAYTVSYAKQKGLRIINLASSSSSCTAEQF